jgi:hypothetical protein
MCVVTLFLVTHTPTHALIQNQDGFPKVEMSRFFAWGRRYRRFDAHWTSQAVLGEFLCRLDGVWDELQESSATLEALYLTPFR